MARKPQIEQDYREKFDVETVEKALRLANGNQSKAAKQLKTSRSTVNGYVKRYPHLEDVISETKESTLDLAEEQLISKIKEGNLTAIIFFLKTQGKARGYVEKPDKVVEIPQRPDFSQLTTEQLEQLATSLDTEASAETARLSS